MKPPDNVIHSCNDIEETKCGVTKTFRMRTEVAQSPHAHQFGLLETNYNHAHNTIEYFGIHEMIEAIRHDASVRNLLIKEQRVQIFKNY